MQSTDLEEIKTALWEQAYHPCTRVIWGGAQVMAKRQEEGTTPGSASWSGALVSCGSRDH
jgi:hypothetical protein